MIDLGTGEVRAIRLSRAIYFEWCKHRLETADMVDIRYQRCPNGYRSPEHPNGANIELQTPHFHTVYLTPSGLEDLPAFQAALAGLDIPPLN